MMELMDGIGVKYDGVDSGYSWWIILKRVCSLDIFLVELAIEDVAMLL